MGGGEGAPVDLSASQVRPWRLLVGLGSGGQELNNFVRLKVQGAMLGYSSLTAEFEELSTVRQLEELRIVRKCTSN